MDGRPRRTRRHVPRGSSALFAFAAVATLTAAGCSNYIGTTAASFLRRTNDSDPNVRYLAYAKLASPNCYDNPGQKAEAVRVLVAKLEKGRDPVASRAVICRTLGELRDPASRDAVLKCVNDPEAVVRVEACRALGKVGRPEDATVLTRVMTVDMLEDCRIAAIDALAELKPNDPRITSVLVNSLRSDDPATRLASLQALRTITGQDLGVEPAPWQKLVGAQTSQTAVADNAAPEPVPSDGVVMAPALPPRHAVPAYPPRPPAIPDPVIDGDTKPAGYPPAPRPYVAPSR